MNLWQKASELFSISSHHTKNSNQFRILGHDSTARDIYCKSNEKIERMSGLMGKYFAKLQIIPQSIIFFLRANLNYYIFDLGEDSFELPVQAVYVNQTYFLFKRSWKIENFFISRLPFNWKTPLGYSIAFTIEGIVICGQVFSFVPLLSFFIGTCWLMLAFARDLTNQLTHLKYHGQTSRSHGQLKIKFNEILQMYSEARQLSISLL